MWKLSDIDLHNIQNNLLHCISKYDISIFLLPDDDSKNRSNDSNSHLTQQIYKILSG